MHFIFQEKGERRPDEEGIETKFCSGLCGEVVGERRPDEEGIETEPVGPS